MSTPGANSRPLDRDLVLLRARTAGAPPRRFLFCDFEEQGELHDQTISSQVSGSLVAAPSRYCDWPDPRVGRARSRARQFPVGERGQRPRDGFHEHHRAGIVARGDRGIGTDFRFRSIQKNIADSLNVVVHVERRPGRRFLSEVLEINGYDPDVDRFDYTLVYARPATP